MQTIRVGLGRLYNASACSNLGRDEILLPFPLGSIEVRAYIGPNPQHIIGTWTVGPPQPQDPAAQKQSMWASRGSLPRRRRGPSVVGPIPESARIQPAESRYHKATRPDDLL